MKATAIALMVCVLVAALIVPCYAGQSRPYKTMANGAKLALHIAAHNAKQNCGNMPTFATRDNIVRQVSGTGDYDVFMVVFGFAGFTGGGFTNVEFGLSWPAEWGSASTTHCADLAIGGIINPYDWLSISWTTCQTTPAIRAVCWSWINASTSGQVQIEYRPGDDPFLGMVDCAFVEIDAESIFFAGVDMNPWEGVPDPINATEPTTWGNIKAMFR
jgi:hypothetical protein